jgi:hypothetical protein
MPRRIFDPLTFLVLIAAIGSRHIRAALVRIDDRISRYSLIAVFQYRQTNFAARARM